MDLSKIQMHCLPYISGALASTVFTNNSDVNNASGFSVHVRVNGINGANLINKIYIDFQLTKYAEKLGSKKIGLEIFFSWGYTYMAASL